MSEAAFSQRVHRSQETSRPSRRRWFVVLIAIVAVSVLVLSAAFALLVVPQLRITRVHVHADFEIDRNDLLELAGLQESVHYFAVNTTRIAARLEEYPLIRTARIEKVFPDAIRMTLARRRPVALTVFNRNGRNSLAAIDENGVVYDAGVHLGDSDLPILSGLEFQGNPVGARLPENLKGFLEDLYHLRIEEPRLFERISELHLVPRSSGGFDILMFTADYRVPVRLAGEINPELFRWSLMVLDVLTQQGLSEQVAEIDFRSGEIVYRLKEDARGR